MVGLAVAAIVPTTVEAKPKGVAVVGSGSAGTGTFTIDAHAKRPSKASGSVTFTLAIGNVVGRVTCVQVQDGVAGVAGRLVAGTTAVDPAQSPGFVLYVADGAVTPSGMDQLQLQFGSSVPAPGGCPPQVPISPAGVTDGDIVILDAST